MQKIIILHGLNCHYHILCSFIEQFQDYEIDLFLPQEVTPNTYQTEKFDGWAQVCDHMNLKYTLVDSIKQVNKKQYDFCVLDTDDDTVGVSYYKRYFNGLPIIVINHERRKARDNINPLYRRHLWTWGTHTPSSDYYFFGCHYLNIDTKMHLLSPRTSVVIVGDAADDVENSPQSLENHIINFNDIDFYIIYRKQPKTYNPLYVYPNITYLISCTTNHMNYILAQSHYIWYYKIKDKCTSCTHMSYSMLCRCVLHQASQHQYEIKTPLFGGDEDRFELPHLSIQDVTAISHERDHLFNRTQQAIRRRLIGDPVICNDSFICT